MVITRLKISSRTFTGSVHFKSNTYKNAKSQSIGAEPGLEPGTIQGSELYPAVLPAELFCIISTRTHTFSP